MSSVRLIHFDADEIDGCVARLRAAGHRVDSGPLGRDPLRDRASGLHRK